MRSSHERSLNGKFSPQDDALLTELVDQYGPLDWVKIARRMEPKTPRQCRDRWRNYLDPSLNNESWDSDSDRLLLQKYSEYGTSWKTLARFFPGRTASNVRNRCQKLLRLQCKSVKWHKRARSDQSRNDSESDSDVVDKVFAKLDEEIAMLQDCTVFPEAIEEDVREMAFGIWPATLF